MAVTKENMKENNNIAIAKLNNCPTSPRKMRIVADLVRGKSVDQALDIFRFSQKEASRKLESYYCLRFQTGRQKIRRLILKMQTYIFMR